MTPKDWAIKFEETVIDGCKKWKEARDKMRGRKPKDYYTMQEILTSGDIRKVSIQDMERYERDLKIYAPFWEVQQ